MLLRPELLLAATTGFRTPHTATTGLRPLRFSHIHSCAATTYPATKALYLEDASLLEATATVLGVEHSEADGWTAVLDATIFHPQGGGQPADRGQLGDATVTAVFSEGRAGSGGVVYHALEGAPDSPPPITVGSEVACKIDSEHRSAAARTHSAGHLIDAAMERCGVTLEPTKGYHFPGSGAYVEYADPPETRMTPEERTALLPKLQAALDELISEDGPTDVATDAEGTRIVTIGGLPCPCGGTHVASSAGIGPVTIQGLKSKGSGKKKALRVSYSME